MNEYAVAAIGEDRPGIVAAVSSALVAAGMGIEDSSMTILGGQFAMLLLVQSDGDSASVETVLRPVADKLDLTLEVRAAARNAEAAGGPTNEWVVAAYGPDRPGLVAALAQVLADAGANVTDFGSRVTDAGTFAMWFNITTPLGADTDELARALTGAGGDVELDVSMDAVSADAF